MGFVERLRVFYDEFVLRTHFCRVESIMGFMAVLSTCHNASYIPTYKGDFDGIDITRDMSLWCHYLLSVTGFRTLFWSRCDLLN
jgi:hypothetical protein